ncbi:unnamed protein product [Rotaria sp. Silwood2]|nr:unnamed protein product [Rotaria sp. Silwood2]CAF4443050.1 unnamed protein product [Rotaria sp. Silwood2]
MPKGKEFSKNEKAILFRVMAFVDSEKYGPKIPLYNVTDRLQVMLGISRQTITKLRQEMSQWATENNPMEEEQEDEDEKSETRTQHQLTFVKSDIEVKQSLPLAVGRKTKRRWTTSSITTIVGPTSVPSPISPKKKGHSGRKKIVLTEYEEDVIRYQFHLLLASKQYPTTAKLLTRLLEDTPDFPIQSESTLLRHMHRLGFKYKATAKISIPLDATNFVASRAKYFRYLNDLRSNDVIVCYHDETWTNSGDEQRYVWVDGKGEGGLRKNEERGELDFFLI